MDKKNLIHWENCFYVVENGKLINAQTYVEEKALPYKCFEDYINLNICYVVLKSSFWVWNKEKRQAIRMETEKICEGKAFTYYRTTNQGDERGNGIHVFALSQKNDIYLFAHSFVHIYDNIYKMGKYAYQLVDNEFEQLCECQEFEKIDVRIEISAGEAGISEMHAFKKLGNRWEQDCVWKPGNIMPDNFTPTLEDEKTSTNTKTSKFKSKKA